ncbi:cold shock domain-containing protein [Kitasatospora sp. NPDC056531]|uniref:cold shock domain-containing protein n=1 Tax=Kitasatospora sp. NPDC056531 TaxID=3345856 RepID=UPI0036CF83A5
MAGVGRADRRVHGPGSDLGGRCARPGRPSNINVNGFRELLEGPKVEFDVTQGQKGPQAENIRPL